MNEMKFYKSSEWIPWKKNFTHIKKLARVIECSITTKGRCCKCIQEGHHHFLLQSSYAWQTTDHRWFQEDNNLLPTFCNAD